MYLNNPAIERILLIFCGAAFAVPAIFFAWYTARLLYINLAYEDAAAHRSGGMLIGAVVFPLAAILFGFISWVCLQRGIRAPRSK